ncbi:16S rRNA (cytosine(1402)-N(4))-methyltransferase RsmH [Corynebacterium pseudodiphtheriticum]|uniref:16S rRNA (cytosine(1402)-N(4))-methyltransferase RsmH n=1 Tax=Corynebacterium pseudodiphtheriticum TaxID=37637 RepID=UPI000398EAA3|nr:16S rRNA (cytosine(1402)-N(4))-methyltransferase RsmH [Corynebacterium pseudodiphtheriticum]ERJ42692.1 16S rRNA methyltransferase [Corynebacterium pseudodiphtheriticum 090104]MDK4249422.1 16S rRNA (cytosine(1402)-N(4))-methyltransferase RsmH [Corynebacterium pseudodiphtheriticum]MDK4273027.1 16S rRNA (cytosine(1402)-N(4))-methyltransferase RsmH [Corynebacterium pseudodiphtheriticum]MDK4328870.1 16S rRNA (cytosine(1402)-N(4))-methyltransferase RsmH [Corynebacterium pseudodiphtheriticum]UNU74
MANPTEPVDAAQSTSEQSQHGHVPVMRDRMAELLAPAVEAAGAPGILVDGTLGAGGHTEYFLQRFPDVRVIGLDRDSNALRSATKRLAPYRDRFCAVQCRFDEFADKLATSVATAAVPSADAGGVDAPKSQLVDAETWNAESQTVAYFGNTEILADAFHAGISGALFDLGVSSMQLDQLERGFAYKADAPLDMRMDSAAPITAADILNTYSHGDLARVLKTYGDEKFAGKIASAVLREREKQPFSTSQRLVELLYATIPAPARRSGGHPAKRTFQALRIEVNQELAAIENALPMITNMLRDGGRAVFMSYQSLEDRLVKKHFRDISQSKTPAGLPMDLPGTAAKFRVITRGAEQASEEEIVENPRAASVRVRAVEKLQEEKTACAVDSEGRS